MSKRLFRASVTIEMFVVADDEREAERVALDHADEEMHNDITTIARVYPVKTWPHLPKDAKSSLPWGGDGDKTCADYLSESIAAAHPAEAAPRGGDVSKKPQHIHSWHPTIEDPNTHECRYCEERQGPDEHKRPVRDLQLWRKACEKVRVFDARATKEELLRELRDTEYFRLSALTARNRLLNERDRWKKKRPTPQPGDETP